MKHWGKYISIVFFILLTGGFYNLYADLSAADNYLPNITPEGLQDTNSQARQDSVTQAKAAKLPQDTLPPKYPVGKIMPEEYQDLLRNHPIDLKNPENFNSNFIYNPATNRYEIRSKIGDMDVATPLTLTQEEYLDYSLQKSRNSFFRKKNEENFLNKGEDKDALSMFDFNFDLGPAEKLFGPGGVKLQAQGGADIKMAMTRTSTGNPTLTEQQRNRTAFDFDAQIQTNISASVGDKINFDLNYNTESTFDFDTKKIKLGYTGKEDEIIKTLEFGNVSMNTTNSLIRGGAALFGIKTELQFGKLTVGAIFSQQESQSRSISSKGTTQTTPFEVTADAYDENTHFFLAHYFRDNYDKNMSTLPYIASGISIDRIEVWVTNKRAIYNEPRNIVAFTDLAEYDSISNKTGFVIRQGNLNIPYNKANTLYQNVTEDYPGARDISTVNQTFEGSPLKGGRDYENIANARKLDRSEYILNSQLGYISLRSPLQPDEVLAVAFEYNYRGQVYQVGEFSTDNTSGSEGSTSNTQQNLYLKLLKGISMSPDAAYWELMMKNIYTITSSGASSIEQDKFKLNIKYQNDTTGIYLNYISEGSIANQLLLQVMNLDRLDSRKESYPDGFFDYVEGYTVISESGKIIFPVIEPFGSHLRKKINDDAIADKYVYQELYDSTLTVARQVAERNKFILSGEYKGSAGNNIELGGSNIARGSVVVSANGVRLKENVDYTVDYATGNVTVINPVYENAKIDISSENQSTYGMQRKTMMGLNLNYAINPNFNIGGTIMNLSEMPITMKTNPGEESINNTLFGFNTNYTTQSQWLTNLVDKLPLVNLTAPSQISFSAEYAKLIPGHYENKYGGNYSYIDDFEQAKLSIDLRSPYAWSLSSTPSFFQESTRANDIEYGKNRSLLAWYYIDGLFTKKSALTPTHIKNDLDQLSNHYVREVSELELFPGKDQRYNESSTLPVFNLAFYPKERGPYNLDARGMDRNGTLLNPQARWGGITRKIESGQTDFEANNIEHIEFWLLDPFIYEPNSPGGDLYFNLGEISEDVLKDGKKFFENGLPINGDTTAVEKTVWGKVPKRQSLAYAFDDNTKGARRIQDVGLNGLSTKEELEFDTYVNYLNDLKSQLDDTTIEYMTGDPFSPLNDPGGDTYHYFRGSDYDRVKMPILGRYKRYNGTEGNSADSDDSPESYNTAARQIPDVEDINQDNTLNENEKYFQYKVSIRPKELEVGNNYIADKRSARVSLKNGTTDTVNWYLFKIPIRDFKDKVGDIRDFKTIRFMRMFLTNFSDSTVLRFGTFELVRGNWRVYTNDLSNPNLPPTGTAAVSLSTVNIEENGDREPVNYVMPPGVNRIMDPSQPQLRQQNEQALSVKITDLAPGDARAIYKSTGLDSRQYRRLQMFTHAEKLPLDVTGLQDDDLSVFLRLGSDYKNNYYEYEIPLKLTPPRPGSKYTNSNSDREIVWPDANLFDFPFELLTDLKLKRNKEKRRAGSTVSYYTPFSEFDPNKPMNKVTIVGNPTISDIKVIMIGVRNNSRSVKSTEVWVNELRLTDFNEDGGWAANANLYVGLSDLATFNFSGNKETAGFGGLDQGIMDRNLDDKHRYSVSSDVQLGKFFPENKVSLPLFYSYAEEVISPKYNPLDQDVLLKDALDAVDSKAEKDSIKNYSQDKITTKQISLNNVRVNVTSKNPMPYDPANFTLGYSFAEENKQNPSTQYERTTDMRTAFAYSYSPMAKPWEPFKTNKSNSAAIKSLKEIGIGYLPSNLSFTSDIRRNYYEVQLRDLNSIGTKIDPSFREDFIWNRTGALQWALTKNLNVSITTGTEARIDAPHVQVNKKFNGDEYTQWKDAVWQSIRDLGTPLDYNQLFTASYNIPFRLIRPLSFISAGISYNATYNWARGATIKSEEGAIIENGNIITNNRILGIDNATLNFNLLYNKIPFLDEVNKKFALKSNQLRTVSARTTPAGTDPKQKPQQKKYEGSIKLNTDSATVVRHQLNNKRLRITARTENGKLYEVKFKAVDNNSIRINNKDSVNLKLTISQLPPLEETTWYKVAQVATRGLMMVRTVSFSYNQTNGLMVPNFRPDVGDFFGQGSTSFGNAPGLDFAFGLTDEGYLDKANQNNWLIKSEDNITPAMYTNSEVFNFTSTLEPFTGMRINLNASRSNMQRKEIYFMYDDAPNKFNGDFNITTIALSSAFEKNDVKNDYHSPSFEKFLNNRQIIANRLEQQYKQTNYPDAGFIASETHYGNTPYSPSVGNVDPNSSDVLIPAFIAAYTGKNANSVGLSAFPSLKSILPNWKITYDGLSQLSLFKKYFKNFTLTHEYKCRYAVGAYSSFLNWVGADDHSGNPINGDLGYIRNVLSENPTPSSPYDITAVSITEAFNPLIGLDAMFLNNMKLMANWNTTRNVNLNVSAYQIVETSTQTFKLDLGYRLTEFNKVLKMRKSGGQNFSNDLTVTAGVSFTKMQSLIRKIQDAFTQATSGDSQTMIKLSADYSLSKSLTIQAFYDRQVNKPLVSSTAYPLTKSSFGVSLRVSLMR